MTKTAYYCEILKTLDDWIPYLEKECNLPGPRGNLELAFTVAETGKREKFEQLLAFDPVESHTPAEFLLFCGVLGLGKLVVEGDLEQLLRLGAYASDRSWRVREATATALQNIGDHDMELLLRVASTWSEGTWLEKRAAAAALAEPRLLKDPQNAAKALNILHVITLSISQASDRTGEGFRVLRQAMGYCWSVVVAALPGPGKPLMETWLASTDVDIRWIMRENLKKNRLLKTDPAWVRRCQAEFLAR
ncbi:MAG TPA: hypothetical protein VGK00_15195 [Anaerolineales bacterium]|jgi:hypothetical protein